MADTNQGIPNVMPDAMIEPITDMELIVAQLKYEGEMNKNSMGPTTTDKKNEEV